MSGFHIDFTWQRDAKGYRLLPARPPVLEGKWIDHPVLGRMLMEPSLLELANSISERIVRCGGELEAYEPLAQFSGLYRQFAAVGSAQELLAFVEKFGPLTQQGLAFVPDDVPGGDDVKSVLNHASLMKKLLLAYSGNHRAEVASAIAEPIVSGLARVEASLILDPTTKVPKLQFTVGSLLSALWLQLGQSLAGGSVVRSCQQCGQLFEAGPGTSRRLDAKFCSEKHQVIFNSLKRAKPR